MIPFSAGLTNIFFLLSRGFLNKQDVNVKVSFTYTTVIQTELVQI